MMLFPRDANPDQDIEALQAYTAPPELPPGWVMGSAAAQDRYRPFEGSRATGTTPWKQMDIADANRDAPRDVALPPANEWLVENVAPMFVPTTPADFALMAAGGPIGRAGGKAVQAGLGGLGVYMTGVDDAQAGAAGAGKTLAKKAMGSIAAEPKAAKTIFTSDGMPVKGGAYTKQSRTALEDIASMPKGSGPMNIEGNLRSDVPQSELLRYLPPRGVSPRLQDALANPRVQTGVRESVESGIELGADKWYHNDPIRREFVKERGKKHGAADYANYMDLIAATSPRSDVPTNIRNASYYYVQGGKDLPGKLPYPYGHVAQNLHRQNYDTVRGAGWDVLQNPKPSSFSQNLQGNLMPGTIDTHAFRNIGMRTEDPRFLETSVSAKYKQGTDPTKDTIVNKYGERKGDTVVFRPQQLHESGKLKLDDALDIPYFWTAKPNDNEYAAAERFYRDVGRDFKLPTADTQGAAWAGGGGLTGLGTAPTHTFPQLMNERILYTSIMRNENPRKTLSDFINKKAPLLTVGGGGAMGAIAAQDGYSQDGSTDQRM